MKRLVTVFLLSLLLGGCVTQTDEKEIDQSEVLRKTLDVAAGYIRQGEYNRAKTHLNNALEMDKGSARAYGLLAFVFQQEEDLELADKYYRRAIQIAPDSAQARNNYGAFLFAQDRYAAAVEQFLLATNDSFYQRRAQVFENLGRSYMRLGEFVKAEEAFLRALELNAAQPFALLELATVRFEQGALVDARFYYEQYERVSRQSAPGAWLCVRIYNKLGNRNKEASCGLALKNLFPESEQYQLYTEWQK